MLLSWLGNARGKGIEAGYFRGHILPVDPASVPITSYLMAQKIIVRWHIVGSLNDVCCTKVPVLTCRLRNGFLSHLISVANEKLWKAPVN